MAKILKNGFQPTTVQICTEKLEMADSAGYHMERGLSGMEK